MENVQQPGEVKKYHPHFTDEETEAQERLRKLPNFRKSVSDRREL